VFTGNQIQIPGMPLVPVYHPCIMNRLYLAQHVVVRPDTMTHCFSTQGVVEYLPIFNDFGPMGMSSIFRFVELIDQKFASHPDGILVYCVESGKKPLTNAIFLLGAYMILKFGMDLHQLQRKFEWISQDRLELYRDASFNESNFDLSLTDCWGGLIRGRKQGWLSMPSGPFQPWGLIDPEEHDYYSSALNADMTAIVPGSLFVLRSPRELGQRDYEDEPGGVRNFSADYLAEIFSELKVGTVVQLCDIPHNTAAFEQRGFHNLALHSIFESHPTEDPSAAAANLFLAAADKAISSGFAVAVHCRSGLGRAATLGALYLMRRHGFTAREAMAWVRIMRPGSIMGSHQHYLVHQESPADLSAAALDAGTDAAKASPAAVAAATAAAATSNASATTRVTPGRSPDRDLGSQPPRHNHRRRGAICYRRNAVSTLPSSSPVASPPSSPLNHSSPSPVGSPGPAFAARSESPTASPLQRAGKIAAAQPGPGSQPGSPLQAARAVSVGALVTSPPSPPSPVAAVLVGRRSASLDRPGPESPRRLRVPVASWVELNQRAR
jgi:cell division cycle 14